jgi:hypothetical protein
VDEKVIPVIDSSTVAEVRCEDPRVAYEHVADALAILRLLQHVRVPSVDTDLQTFGLPGQVAQWQVHFIDLLAGSAEGFFRGGAVPGWAFSEDDHAAFVADAGLQFLSRALANNQRTRLEQRGLLGARLLSTSMLEHDPDRKLLAAVMALEVLIGDDARGPKKFRLARRHSFLACSVPTSSMCGRDRPCYPYLALDPDVRGDAEQLEILRTRHRSGDLRVRCSEYYRIIDLYDARSRAVHDGTVGVQIHDIRNARYPVYRWLMPKVFDWYARHPDDAELRQLGEEIRRTAITRPPPEPVPD